MDNIEPNSLPPGLQAPPPRRHLRRKEELNEYGPVPIMYVAITILIVIAILLGLLARFHDIMNLGAECVIGGLVFFALIEVLVVWALLGQTILSSYHRWIMRNGIVVTGKVTGVREELVCLGCPIYDVEYIIDYTFPVQETDSIVESRIADSTYLKNTAVGDPIVVVYAPKCPQRHHLPYRLLAYYAEPN